MYGEEIRTRGNTTLRLRVSFKDVNLSTFISTNYEFRCAFCEQLWFLGYPTLLTLGLVGNLLCLLAFAAHKLRSETRLLCTLLAAFDTLVLFTAFVTRWPVIALDVSPVHLHRVFCHIITIASYWLPELAAWTLVEISIERVLSGISYVIIKFTFCYNGVYENKSNL